MKKFSLILTLLMLCSLFAVPATAVDKPGSYNKFGTKAYGMGGAFSAVADDASAVYWNPAGLTQTNLVGLQASGGAKLDYQDIKDIMKFIEDAQESSSDVSSSSDIEAIEDSIKDMPSDTSINLNGMTAVNLKNFGAGVIANDQLSFSKSSKSFAGTSKELPSATAENNLITQAMVGYGTNIIDPPIVGSLAVGGTGKLLSQRVDSASFEPYFDENSTELGYKTDAPGAEIDTGFGADVGALATVSDIDVVNVKAGATVRNLFTTGLDSDDPTLQRTVTLGTGVTFKFPLVEVLSAKVAADLEMPEDGDNIKRLGAEGTVGLFSLRTGVYGTDLGNDDKRTITGGVGFNLPFIDVNLAADSDKYVNFSGTFNF